MMARCTFGGRIARFLEYDTPQILHTNSKLVGIFFRILQLFIFVFIFGYYMIFNRGYQDVSNTITNSVRIIGEEAKAAPVASSEYPLHMVFKDTEKFFLPTYGYQYSQVWSRCAEERDVIGAVCDPMNNHCRPNITFHLGHGRTTGACVSSKGSVLFQRDYPVEEYFGCEIKGWCIIKKDFLPFDEMLNVKEMGLIVENDVFFPKFENSRMVSNYNRTVLHCLTEGRYYSKDDPFCPYFKIGSLLKAASKVDGKLKYTYNEIIRQGAVFSVEILWDCNFDVQEPFKDCNVDYKFRRLDNNEDIATSPDIKFASVEGHVRLLFHIYGIRFVTLVRGTARKFNLFTFLTRIGASAGLFAIASLLCEVMIMLSCCRQVRVVRDFKFVDMESQFMERRMSTVGPRNELL